MTRFVQNISLTSFQQKRSHNFHRPNDSQNTYSVVQFLVKSWPNQGHSYVIVDAFANNHDAL